MYFDLQGNKKGEAILFIHGLGVSSRLWLDHVDAFKDEYYCLAPDLPGHRKSNKIAWTTIEDVSDEIYDFVRKKKIKKLNIVALSLGGNIALDFISKHGDMVRTAVIDGTGVFPVKPTAAVRLAAAAVSRFLKYDKIIKFVADSLGIKSGVVHESFAKDLPKINPDAFIRALSQANEQVEPKELRKVKTKVLFVTGERDLKRVLISNKYLSKRMLKAKSYLIPKDGHAWLVRDCDLHIKVTRAWLKGRKLPKVLIKQKSS